MPALIDKIDDKVGQAYGGWPDRLYLVGKDGKIAYAGRRGPAGFAPEEWEKAIVAELQKLRTPAPTAPGMPKDKDKEKDKAEPAPGKQQR